MIRLTVTYTVAQATAILRAFPRANRARWRLWLVQAGVLGCALFLLAGGGVLSVTQAARLMGLLALVLGAIVVLSPWWLPRVARRRWTTTTTHWCLDADALTMTSLLGVSSVPWARVAESVQFQGLFVMRTHPPRQVVALPLAQLDDSEIEQISRWAANAPSGPAPSGPAPSGPAVDGGVAGGLATGAAGAGAPAGRPATATSGGRIAVTAGPLTRTQARTLVTRFRSRTPLGISAVAVAVVDVLAVLTNESLLSVTVFTAGAGGLLAAVTWSGPWLDARRLLRLQHLVGTWAFDAAGVRHDGPSGQIVAPWSAFRQVSADGDLLLLNGRPARRVIGVPVGDLGPDEVGQVLVWAGAGGVAAARR